MTRQEGDQIGDHADRPDTRAAATVRNAECLVQVQVADVATELARRGNADQRVHVGPVDIHAAAMTVDDLAQLAHAPLEHAVGGGVGDHHAGEAIGVLLALGLEVGEVDVALGVALGDDDPQPRHLRARRVGAVRRLRDQADRPRRLAARCVPGTDREQARVLALRAGVGLQADAGIAGRFAEPRFELAPQRVVAGLLIGGRERMDVRELGPGDRDHLAGRVQLHRARAERDHRAVEGEVLVGEATQVAQHPGFAVVAIEDRMRQERGRAPQAFGDQRRDAALEVGELRQRLACLGEDTPQGDDVGARRRLVERDAKHRVAPLEVAAQVHPGRDGTARQLAGRRAGVDRDRSKALSPRTVKPSRLSPSARIAVYEATRSAIRFSPCGPW